MPPGGYRIVRVVETDLGERRCSSESKWKEQDWSAHDPDVTPVEERCTCKVAKAERLTETIGWFKAMQTPVVLDNDPHRTQSDHDSAGPRPTPSAAR